MTDKEHQELNCWIAEHAMGCWKGFDADGKPCWCRKRDAFNVGEPVGGANTEMVEADWSPTTDPAAAMEVLKKCQDVRCLAINKNSITSLGGENEKAIVECGAETLELAIVLFAKKLFSK